MSLTLTDTEVELYGGKVWEEYRITDRFGSEGMIYYGPEAGEAINVPTVQGQSAANKADNTDHRGKASELVGITVPLFEPIKAHTDIPKSKVKIRPDLRLLENLGKEHGRAVGNDKTIQLAAFLAKVADTASNIIEIDVTGNNPGTAVAQGIEAIASRLDKLGVPPQGRHGCVDSANYYHLARERGVYGLEFGGKAGIQTENAMGSIPYLNFMVKNLGTPFGLDLTDQAYDDMALPTPAQFDMTDVLGIFWHDSSWAMRVQEELNYTAKFLDQYQAWLTLARMQIGYKERESDAIYILIQDPSA